LVSLHYATHAQMQG